MQKAFAGRVVPRWRRSIISARVNANAAASKPMCAEIVAFTNPGGPAIAKNR
jgi:hypothetical protein